MHSNGYQALFYFPPFLSMKGLGTRLAFNYLATPPPITYCHHHQWYLRIINNTTESAVDVVHHKSVQVSDLGLCMMYTYT